MEVLWSPWRHEYISSAASDKPACIFCTAKADPNEDENNLVVYRGSAALVMLNRYPYISGHLMIAPYAHVSSLTAASNESTHEMIELATRCERVLQEVYKPEGFNLGMNLGRVAGAGVADHIHL